MVFKNFRLNIIIRVLLLCISLFGFLFLFQKEEYLITPFVCALLSLFLVYSIIQYTEKTNRKVTTFLQSIRYSDFSRSFSSAGHGESFDELQKAFDDVIKDFQKIRAEKEEHYFYLQNVIQHIGIGILSYQKNGAVELINNAAKKLFQVASLQDINELGNWNPEITEKLFAIQPGENILVKIHEDEEILHLSIYATSFKVNERNITLVSIKNIQAELEEKEMESWQKLIRVLTHEIMNSIAPIASLTSTANHMVESLATALSGPEEEDTETLSDIKHALQTIHKRSTGLIHFVETYRNLTKIPKPNFSIFRIEKLFSNIHHLLEETIQKHNITCICQIEPKTLELTADEQLIEQVIINMVTNSIHALDKQHNGVIKIISYLNKRGRVTIQVIDNGRGIIPEVLDKIFIPFFTTKPTGSGIGLSLSKQIMRLHGGSIAVKSTPDVETCFTLSF